MASEKSSGLILVGAGLPRTGTLSTRCALTHLLSGNCHHMADVFAGGQKTLDFWDKALTGSVGKEDWVRYLEGGGYLSGVDAPISMYYK